MVIPYTTLAVIGPNIPSLFDGEVLPAFPFPYLVARTDTAGCVILYPEAVRDVPNVGDFAAISVSSFIENAVVVLAIVDAEDTLRLRFFRSGVAVDEYCTEPGRTSGEELPPSGGDVVRLAELFGMVDPVTLAELSDVLSATRYDDQFGFGESNERHREIANLLDLPFASIGIGYESIQRGLMPEGVAPGTLRHSPSRDDLKQSGIELRQFVLFRPKMDESDAEIAARFLADVISWEDDFLGDGLPTLGTLESIQTQMSEIYSNDETHRGVIIDPVEGDSENVVIHVNIFTHSPGVSGTLFAQLCMGKPWSVWSYESRRTVYRSDAPSA